MKDLFGAPVAPVKTKKKKIEKPPKVYKVTDEEFCYFFVARSPGDARAAYVNESGMYSFDETFDAIQSIVRVPALDKFIEKGFDFSYTINPWEEEYWTRAVYEIGGYFEIDCCDGNTEDQKLTLEQMLGRKCPHGEALDDERVYIDLPKKKTV